MSVDFVTLDRDGRAVDIEYQWLGRDTARPLLVCPFRCPMEGGQSA